MPESAFSKEEKLRTRLLLRKARWPNRSYLGKVKTLPRSASPAIRTEAGFQGTSDSAVCRQPRIRERQLSIPSPCGREYRMAGHKKHGQIIGFPCGPSPDAAMQDLDSSAGDSVPG